MKKQRATLALTIALLFALSHFAVAQNLLLNGEFTSPSGDNEAADNWMKAEDTIGGNGSAIDSFRFQKSQFADRSKGTDPSIAAPGPDGDAATNDVAGLWFRGFLGNNGDNPNILADASAWQDVSASAGQYELTFWEKQEFYFQAAEAGVSLEYYDSNTLLGSDTLDLLATPGTNTTSGVLEPFALRTLTGTAPAGTNTVRVLAFMEDGSNNEINETFKPQGLMLDGFSLTAVPEPSSFGMLAICIPVMAAVRRRRR